jgi:hypothetical protein
VQFGGFWMGNWMGKSANNLAESIRERSRFSRRKYAPLGCQWRRTPSRAQRAPSSGKGWPGQPSASIRRSRDSGLSSVIHHPLRHGHESLQPYTLVRGNSWIMRIAVPVHSGGKKSAAGHCQRQINAWERFESSLGRVFSATAALTRARRRAERK